MNTLPAMPAVRQDPAGPLRAWNEFWFTPADPVALHRIRLLTGLLLLAWLLPLVGQRNALFGISGWLDAHGYQEISHLPDGLPQPVSWSVLYACRDNSTLLAAATWLAVGIIVAFALGLWTRLSAILAWVVVVSFTTNPLATSEADPLLRILALYLMIGYLFLGPRPGTPLGLSLLGQSDQLLFGRRRNVGQAGPPSIAANTALRLLQVHFAVVVLSSGLHKLQFADWWSGVALWQPLHPPLQLTLERLRDETSHLSFTLGILSIAAYAALAWQLGFPAFAWRPRWRPVLLAGAVIAWLATALLYHQPLFGPAYALCCLSYLPPRSWCRVDHWIGRLFPWARHPVEDEFQDPRLRAPAGKGQPTAALAAKHP